MAIAFAAIGILIALSLGPARGWLARKPEGWRPPHPLILFVLSGIVVAVVFGLELLSFGIHPAFPPSLTVAIGLLLIALMIVFVPRFQAHEDWGIWHQVGMHYGAVITNMAVFFVPFLLDSTPIDFYGKVVIDIFAVVFLVWLAMKLRASQSLISAHAAHRNYARET